VNIVNEIQRVKEATSDYVGQTFVAAAATSLAWWIA